MRIRVLGSAAGGGFPQWNCGCPNCEGVRTGALTAEPRTQDSLAVSGDGERFFLLNASPEVRQQIESFPRLHPRGRRHSPIAAIVLTNGDLDHCLGLLSLRESHPLVVYCTEPVRRGLLGGNVMLRTLQRFAGQVTWRPLELDREIDLAAVDGAPSGLTVRALPVAGKLPVHLEGIATPDPADNVGLFIREAASGRLAAYVPGAGAVGALPSLCAAADCLFFDGTFWSGDELVRLGLADRRAEEMAHLPVGGAAGSLAQLAACTARRKLFTHINNTNPILVEDSPERAAVAAAGWEVARDGMDLHL